ncbi:MAG: oligosaccharide flippase family protein [Candidatus Marinimicrobia bacterium]|nr:oligosaccharide flippase family protein [Candidatus Neomarinimicrobiota bacterium]MBL7114003.1 oligosaccharide flippase family protein [Bacteroidales bacterium]
MISKSFFKSSIIYTVVGALPYMSGFILLFWFTAWLTPVQFGINALYLSLMYFVLIVSTAGWDMSVGILHFDYRDNETKLKEFIGTVYTGLLILGGGSLILFSLGGFQFFRFTFSGGDFLELVPFGMFTILSGIFNGIFKSYTGLLVNLQKPVLFFWLNLSNFIITIIASLTLLYLFPYTLYGPVLGRLIPAIISAAISLIMVARHYGFHWHVVYFRKILSYSAPLLVSAILLWVVTYIDRFIILKFLADPVLVGVYDIAIKLVLGIDLLIAGLVNSITPKVYSIWKSQNISHSTVEVNRYYNALTALVLVLIPVIIILAPIILPFLIKKPIYYQAFQYLPLLAAGYAARVWFYMFLAPIMFFKRTRAMITISVISAVVQIGVGIVMIKMFGLWGAVLTNILIKIVQAIFLYLESRKVFQYKINKWKIVYFPILVIMLVFASEIFISSGYRIWAAGFQLIFTCALIYLTYRRELSELVGKLSHLLYKPKE